MYHRAFPTSLLLLGGLAACAGPTFVGKPLPPLEEPATLPLLHPLTYQRTIVLAELTGPEATVAHDFWVDTGAHRTKLTRRVAEALGLEATSSRFLSHRDVTQTSKDWEGVVVPRLVSGDFLFENVPMSLEDDADLLGDEFLSQAPVTIDYDRGVLVLGSQPLSGPEVTTLSYVAESEPGHRNIDLELDGHRVLMNLDTGAGLALDDATGRALGLPVHRLGKAWTSGGVRGTYQQHGYYLPRQVSLGPVSYSGLRVHPLPRWREGGLFNRKVVGLAGWDVLSPWVHRLDPETQQLTLAPRRDVLATTPERVARWPWVPRCEGRPACLEAGLSVTEKGLSLTVTPEGPWTRRAWVLLGFVGPEGGIVREAGLLSVEVDFEDPSPRTVALDPPKLQAAWLATGQFRPVVLDVNPVMPRELMCVILEERPIDNETGEPVPASEDGPKPGDKVPCDPDLRVGYASLHPAHPVAGEPSRLVVLEARP